MLVLVLELVFMPMAFIHYSSTLLLISSPQVPPCFPVWSNEPILKHYPLSRALSDALPYDPSHQEAWGREGVGRTRWWRVRKVRGGGGEGRRRRARPLFASYLHYHHHHHHRCQASFTSQSLLKEEKRSHRDLHKSTSRGACVQHYSICKGPVTS